MDAEGRVLFIPVGDGSIDCGHFQELGRIRCMGHEQFDNGFPDTVYFGGTGPDDDILLGRVHAGDHKPG